MNLSEYFLSSESDSDEEQFQLEMLAYMIKKRRRKSSYLEKRCSHGEFALTNEFSDEKFKNYFRLDRAQFMELHELVKMEISVEGCNTSTPIETQEKLACFLR